MGKNRNRNRQRNRKPNNVPKRTESSKATKKPQQSVWRVMSETNHKTERKKSLPKLQSLMSLSLPMPTKSIWATNNPATERYIDDLKRMNQNFINSLQNNIMDRIQSAVSVTGSRTQFTDDMLRNSRTRPEDPLYQNGNNFSSYGREGYTSFDRQYMTSQGEGGNVGQNIFPPSSTSVSRNFPYHQMEIQNNRDNDFLVRRDKFSANFNIHNAASDSRSESLYKDNYLASSRELAAEANSYTGNSVTDNSDLRLYLLQLKEQKIEKRLKEIELQSEATDWMLMRMNWNRQHNNYFT